MRRRDILAAGAATAGATTAGLAAPAIAQGITEWNMVMPWPRGTPGVGVNAERFATRVTEMTGGRLAINLFAAGELVPPFEGLDAVSSGTADCGHAPPYFWVGKAPVLNYFTGIPFGLTATELAAWFQFGGALELWQEIYDEFNVIPFYAGSSGVQAGGWFRNPINSLADLQGIRFRIAGLGGEVMRRLGVNTVLILDAMARETWNVLEDLAATDDHTRRVHESFMSFLLQCDRYAASFDTAILQLRHRAMELL